MSSSGGAEGDGGALSGAGVDAGELGVVGVGAGCLEDREFGFQGTSVGPMLCTVVFPCGDELFGVAAEVCFDLGARVVLAFFDVVGVEEGTSERFGVLDVEDQSDGVPVLGGGAHDGFAGGVVTGGGTVPVGDERLGGAVGEVFEVISGVLPARPVPDRPGQGSACDGSSVEGRGGPPKGRGLASGDWGRGSSGYRPVPPDPVGVVDASADDVGELVVVAGAAEDQGVRDLRGVVDGGRGWCDFFDGQEVVVVDVDGRPRVADRGVLGGVQANLGGEGALDDAGGAVGAVGDGGSDLLSEECVEVFAGLVDGERGLGAHVVLLSEEGGLDGGGDAGATFRLRGGECGGRSRGGLLGAGALAASGRGPHEVVGSPVPEQVGAAVIGDPRFV